MIKIGNRKVIGAYKGSRQLSKAYLRGVSRFGLVSNEPEVDAYIDGLATPLSPEQITSLNTLVKDLKQGLSVENLSNAFDVFYVLAGETEESSLRNLVKRAHDAEPVNSPTFTQYVGIKGDGIGSYIKTNYIPRTDGSNYKLNDASHGCYMQTDANKSIYGSRGSDPTSILNNSAHSSTLYYPNSVNAGGGGSNLYTGALTGSRMYKRQSATREYRYENGVPVSYVDVDSVALPSHEVFIFCRNNQGIAYGFSTTEIAWFFIGRGITDSEAVIINDALNSYLADAEQKKNDRMVTYNPYSGIDFNSCNKYKAALHTHTNLSDGTNTPIQMIEEYAAFDFDILSLTDHDFNGDGITPTWKWSDKTTLEVKSFADQDCELYEVNGKDILAVIGNEISNGHHRQSLLCDLWQSQEDYNTYKSNLDWTIGEIENKNGVSFLNHPINPYHTGYPTHYDIDDYKTLFTKYDTLLGLEVINSIRTEYVLGPTTGAEPIVEKIWDALLLHFMPGRVIIGFSTDDSHNKAVHSFFGYTMFLMPELTPTAFRNAISSGHCYFCLETSALDIDNHKPLVATPIINNIVVSSESIIIDAENVLINDGVPQIEWISGLEGETPIVVHTGNVLPLDTVGLKNYVRARIKGTEGRLTFTQAFGLALK